MCQDFGKAGIATIPSGRSSTALEAFMDMWTRISVTTPSIWEHHSLTDDISGNEVPGCQFEEFRIYTQFTGTPANKVVQLIDFSSRTTTPALTARACAQNVASSSSCNTKLQDFIEDPTAHYARTGGPFVIFDGVFCRKEVAQPPSIPPPNAPGVGSYQDPHLQFAHGGVADFRGTHNDYYNFLSVPNLSVNVKVENATFWYGNTEVHGSFMTEMSVHAIVGGDKHKIIKMSHVADRANSDNWSWKMVNGTCGGHHFYLGPHASKHCEEFVAITDMSTSMIKVHDWIIYTSTNHVYNRISGPFHRIDIAIQLNTSEKLLKVAPHGIIGQSYDNDMFAVDGKQDVYPDSGVFYTSAQAEGAIEGDYTMYRTKHRYDTDFKFSRFNATHAEPRSLEKMNVRHIKSNIEHKKAYATDDLLDSKPSLFMDSVNSMESSSF